MKHKKQRKCKKMRLPGEGGREVAIHAFSFRQMEFEIKKYFKEKSGFGKKGGNGKK